MNNLGDIGLENTVTVKVDCQINEDIVIKNFKIIIDCLNQLKANQDSHTNTLDQHRDRLSKLQLKIKQNDSSMNIHSKEQTNQHNQANSDLSSDQLQKLKNQVQQISKKADKNESGILDNIKDINVLNKQVSELKNQLSKHSDPNNSSNADTKSNNSGNEQLAIDSLNQMKKSIQNNCDEINKIKGQLENLKKLNNQLTNKLNEIENIAFNSVTDTNKNQGQKGKNNSNDDENSTTEKSNMNAINDKIGMLQRKVNKLADQTQQNSNSIQSIDSNLNNLNKEHQNLNGQVQELKKLFDQFTNNKNLSDGSMSEDDLNKLMRQIERLNKEIEKLKKQTIGSKTSIEDDSSRKFDRGAYTQTKFGKDDDKLRDLTNRIQYLEKMIGSKKSLEDQSKSNQDKLPLIKRPHRREKDSSFYDRSNKKDMNEVKNQLQNWLTNYLASNKNKDNFEDLELKIQEIKNLLGKKADHEGMRKGLTFLESKINQLYLFLTEPDGEDAMIVRKGFNCLSCSKKVEKLRGKLGPHINWNNMTATNYSPPKVGYSKNMEHSPEGNEDY